VFCDYEGPNQILWSKGSDEQGVFVVRPLRRVTPGHVLVIPRRHASDFADDPVTTALVFGAAAEYARSRVGDANLITSRGASATQTVGHLHVHVVPRTPGDGLLLPWSEGSAGMSPTVAEEFGRAVDLLDQYVGFDDDVMNPIRAALRKVEGTERPRNRSEL
jgi:histidine triad (HIT) family protein